MNQEIFRHLLYQYITGELSGEDRILLNDLLKRPEYTRVLNDFVTEFMESNEWEGQGNPAIGAAIHQHLDRWINAPTEQAPVVSLTPSTNETPSIQPAGALIPQSTRLIPIHRKRTMRAVAAVFILLAGIGAGTISLQRYSQSHAPAIANIATRYKNDLSPGVNGAILTLANGQHIVLDSAGNGTLAVQGNTRLINHNGQITYKGEGKSSQELFNTMTTPKGRQYQLTLADGTKVWLNAASSIRFPTAFSGSERKVEITGEAYFEVATPTLEGGHEKTPFKVHIDPPSGEKGIDIEVLGTHFNVNAYGEEATVQTTLLEGAVKVSTGIAETVLRPGQQARIRQSGASVPIDVMNDVNTDIVMGWKNGYFTFQHTDLRTVMRQIARWYDVDITYTGKVPERRFGGEIPRNSNASDVLKILEKSKVYFRIEGKKIIVLPEQESQNMQDGH